MYSGVYEYDQSHLNNIFTIVSTGKTSPRITLVGHQVQGLLYSCQMTSMPPVLHFTPSQN